MRGYRPEFECLEDRRLLAATWISQGPAPAASRTYVIQGIVGDATAGAVTGIAIDPTNVKPGNPYHVVIGTADGGVWTTNDLFAAGGPVWTARTDGMPFLGINDVAFSPLDNANQAVTINTAPSTEVIYAGTGRFSNSFRQSGQGVGVYKSTDGGATWSQVGATTFTGLNITKVLPTNVVDATTNAAVVLAAVANGTSGGPRPPVGSSQGLYRSADGGNTWSLLSGTAIGGAATGLPAGAVTDIVYSSGDNRYYAAVPGKGVYFSVNGGKTWTETAGNDELEITDANSRIALAVSGNSGVVYAGVVDKSGTGNELRAVFRSDDKGATWTSMGKPNGQFGINPGKQAYIDFAIVADPLNVNLVYVSGDRQDTAFYKQYGTVLFGGIHFRGDFGQLPNGPVWASLDGSAASNTTPHPDTRFMAFDPSGSFLLESDDGGLYRLDRPSGTGPGITKWFSANGNLSAFELNSTSYDSVNHTFFGGSQDNGSPQQNVAGATNNWTDQTGGDGQVSQVFNRFLAGKSVLSFHYTTSQGLGTFINTEYNASGEQVNRVRVYSFVTNLGNQYLGKNNAGRFTIDQPAFDTIYALNAVDPYRILIGTSFLYEGNYPPPTKGYPLVSLGGAKQGTRLDGSQGLVPNGKLADGVSAIAFGTPGNADLTYVGTFGFTTDDDGNRSRLLQRTAAAAPGVTNGLPNGFKLLTTYAGGTPLQIVIDPNNANNVYIVDRGGDIWRTTDAGATNFVKINGAGLPTNLGGSLPTNVRSIALFSDAKAPAKSVLFAGGQQGVFALTDPANAASPAWSAFGTGLPSVGVNTLIYNLDDNVLVAGTFGRGVWQVSNVSNELGEQASTLQLNGGSGTNFAATFTQGGGAIAAVGAATLTITDADDTALRSARILLTNPLDGAAESLDANVAGTGITKSYDAVSGILTLTGTDTLANYQMVLRTVAYHNTAASPNDTSRIIVFTVYDGAVNSNRANSTITVAVAAGAPDVDASGVDGQAGEANYTADDPPGMDRIAPQAAVQSAGNITQAVITITNPQDVGQETLTVDIGASGLSAAYNPGTYTLTITGSASAGTYQQVIRTLSFADAALVPSEALRSVTIIVRAGAQPSPAAEIFVHIIPLNHAPVIDPTATFSMLPIVTGQVENEGTLVSTLLRSLSPGSGPVSDPDGDGHLGIAVIGVDNTNGVWEYFVGESEEGDAEPGAVDEDSGDEDGDAEEADDGWEPFDSPSDSHATVLPDNGTTRVRFVPNPGFVGTVANGLIFRAWDQTVDNFGDESEEANGQIFDVSVNGGNTAFSATTATASITVTAALGDTIGVFRPSGGTFFLLDVPLPPAGTSTSFDPATTNQFQFGATGDIAVSGDWLGTGQVEMGVFRPSTGTWYLSTTNGNYDPATVMQVRFGMSGDVPVAGHWLGTNVSYIGVFRPSTGTWYLNTVMPAVGVPGTYSAATTIQVQFGTSGDVPVVGEWLSDSFDRIGVFRASAGTWYLDEFGDLDDYRDAGTSAYVPELTARVLFGTTGDFPVVGDWLGDGFDHIGVFRPSAGTWYLDTELRLAGTSAYELDAAIQVLFGAPGDMPVPGNWLADGIDRPGVFRPSTNAWFLDEEGADGFIEPKTARPIGQTTAFQVSNAVQLLFGYPGDQVFKGEWLV
ncbi:MAG: glycoside hydrolase [Gemmataceae bacterium]|nr:glycoside hydrolase [Gemmataceae bacterium]